MPQRCPSCDALNPERARFCSECGTSLARACPTCEEPLLAGQRFCNSCGTALEPGGRSAPPAPAVERRLCSVLFCDLVGFTTLSENRDAEAVRELLSAYFDAARAVIDRYGGVIEKFIGDAVMAVWGAPATTEDDAERAARAALELVDTVAQLGRANRLPQLAARCGVVSGEVAVTLGAQGQGMVAGDAVNTAARLQASADPGTVLVDESTARRVGASIELTELPVEPVRGRTSPVARWRASRVMANVGGAQRIDGLEAPLIGRDVEVRLLKDLFHAGVERSASQLVLVTGAAGSGKSRLGWEFEKYVDGLADTVLWHRGRCLSYGHGISYWALAEAVRQRAGIAEEDSPDVALPKLLACLEGIVRDRAERSFVGVRLGRLLALQHPDDDEARIEQGDLFAGWRTFFVRLAEQAPVVWLIEDLQWADEHLLAFLDHLLDWSRTVPVTLIGFARPELGADRPAWVGGRRRQQVLLEPLSDADMQRLITALVPDMPSTAVDQIAARAEGVPLFAVETVRALIDRDAVVPRGGSYHLVGGELGELGVPDTLRALLSARLDLLEPDRRTLVSAASVLGDTFPAEALAAVLRQPVDAVRTGLDALLERDLLTVSADPLSPQRGSYAFTNELVRRVAMETLSRHDRKALRLAVVEHLRSAFAGNGDEVAEVIARHLLDAADEVPDASDVDDLLAAAVAELRRAAARAERTGALSRAADAYVAAADRTPDPREAADLLDAAAEAATGAARFGEAVAHADRARDLYAALGDERRAAISEAHAGGAFVESGDLASAIARLERAVEVLQHDPDGDAVYAMGRLASAKVFTLAEDAEQWSRAVLDLADRVVVRPRDVVSALIARAVWHGFAGHRSRAVAYSREAARIAEAAGDDRGAATAYSNLAADLIDGDPEAAAAAAELGILRARTSGRRMISALAASNRVEALLILGRWDEAAGVLDDALDLDGAGSIDFFLSSSGALFVLRGDGPATERALAAAESLAVDDPQVLCLFMSLRAAAAATPQAALRLAQEAIGYADALGITFDGVRRALTVGSRAAHSIGDLEAERSMSLLLDARSEPELSGVLLGERALIRGRLAAAERPTEAAAAFDDAITRYRAIPAPHDLAHALLDRAQWLPGEADDEAVAEAERIGLELGAEPLLDRVRRVRADRAGVTIR